MKNIVVILALAMLLSMTLGTVDSSTGEEDTTFSPMVKFVEAQEEDPDDPDCVPPGPGEPDPCHIG